MLEHKVFGVISKLAEELNVKAYVIGGYVRDILLDRPSKDIDIVVDGDGIELAKAVSKAMGSGTISIFKNFGTAQVVLEDCEVEFVGARKESYSRDSRKPKVEGGSLEDDQKRRDFTINAMAFSLNKADYGTLVDPFNGVQDLHDRIIRTPLDPLETFSDDPLRMIRAVRFASQLGFDIEEKTYNSLSENKSRLSIISRERIAEELNKILLSPRPSVGFWLFEETGLISEILPQLEKLKGTETKEGVGHKDNFSHTLQVLDQLSETSNNLWLRWAALLHDIGKPATKHFHKSLGWTFHGHEVVGSRIVVDIFRDLRLPMNEKMKYVQKLVFLHLRPMALAEEVTDSAVRRLLFDAGDDIDDLMLLAEADITSKNMVKVKRLLDNFKTVRIKLQEVEAKDQLRNWQPPVSGEDIMAAFSLSPSKAVGDLKLAIREAILEGEITNDRNEALELLLRKGNEMGLTANKEWFKSASANTV